MPRTEWDYESQTYGPDAGDPTAADVDEMAAELAAWRAMCEAADVPPHERKLARRELVRLRRAEDYLAARVNRG